MSGRFSYKAVIDVHPIFIGSSLTIVIVTNGARYLIKGVIKLVNSNGRLQNL